MALACSIFNNTVTLTATKTLRICVRPVLVTAGSTADHQEYE